MRLFCLLCQSNSEPAKKSLFQKLHGVLLHFMELFFRFILTRFLWSDILHATIVSPFYVSTTNATVIKLFHSRGKILLSWSDLKSGIQTLRPPWNSLQDNCLQTFATGQLPLNTFAVDNCPSHKCPLWNSAKIITLPPSGLLTRTIIPKKFPRS